MDTQPPQPDAVLTQLKKLREGRGLSPQRLEAAPEVIAAVASNTPAEAYEALQRVLVEMPDSERLRALVVDFGFNLDELLGRPPTSREVDFLGERRAGYAAVVGRDPKTLARWSDRTLAELRSNLVTESFDGHVIVAAGVSAGRLAGVEVLRYEKTDENLSAGRNVGYTNPETERALPLLLYSLPRTWSPASLRFVVTFLDGTVPLGAWALVSNSVLDVSFGHERTPLVVADGMVRCRVEGPRRDQLYGVWWDPAPAAGPGLAD